jgi:ribonuclease P protein component
LDIVVLSRKGMDSLSNSEFSQQLNQQWQRIFKKVRHHRLTSQAQNQGAEQRVNADAKATDQ